MRPHLGAAGAWIEQPGQRRRIFFCSAKLAIERQAGASWMRRGR